MDPNNRFLRQNVFNLEFQSYSYVCREIYHFQFPNFKTFFIALNYTLLRNQKHLSSFTLTAAGKMLKFQIFLANLPMGRSIRGTLEHTSLYQDLICK